MLPDDDDDDDDGMSLSHYIKRLFLMIGVGYTPTHVIEVVSATATHTLNPIIQ